MKFVLIIVLFLHSSCASYAPVNPSNSGNGWIVKKSLFSDSLMYCFAPASKNDKPVCIDAIDPLSITGDGLDTFVNPKKSK